MKNKQTQAAVVYLQATHTLPKVISSYKTSSINPWGEKLPDIWALTGESPDAPTSKKAKRTDNKHLCISANELMGSCLLYSKNPPIIILCFKNLQALIYKNLPSKREPFSLLRLMS